MQFSLAVFIFYFITIPVFAWNAMGHVVVSQMAYENVSSKKQLQLEKLAGKIFYQLSFSEQYALNHAYPHTSLFAKVSILPDQWKGKTLGELFHQFHAVIPSDLVRLSDKGTRCWHFISFAWPQSTDSYTYSTHPINHINNHTNNHTNIVSLLNILKKDFETSENETTQALLMIFIAHLVGDIHQPLHTASNFSLNFRGDAGGNGFCLKRSTEGECEENLHAYWDSAGGYLYPDHASHIITHELEETYPLDKLHKSSCYAFSPKNWALESYKKVGVAYEATKNTMPSPEQEKIIQEIARKQLALAAYRLARIV